jgi:NADH:ubiquinone oxidoreductase subunit E
MSADAKPIEIVICLGSSCFARGNPENLAIVEEFVQKHRLNATIRISGKLCQDECKLGPNVTVAGETHHEVTAAKMRQVLQQLGVRPPEA